MPKKFKFTFPPTKWVGQNTIAQQVDKIEGELREVKAEYTALVHTGKYEQMDLLAEEVMDLYHSAETLLRILQEDFAVDLLAVGQLVYQKNLARHYYRAQQ